jgi:glutamyl-tRNA synthetase
VRAATVFFAVPRRRLVPEDPLDELARRFALQNALDHGGEADPGAVIGRVMAYDDAFQDRPEEVQRTAGRVVQEVNGMSADEQEAALADLGAVEMEAKDTHREGLPPLPGADGVDEVVMRFAPNPNGPPSLGHSRGMCLNAAYAEDTDGHLLLRFDDTDPVNKTPWEPAYEMFEEAFDWLGAEVDQVLCASERLDTYHEHARRALEEGGAYTCECTPERFREHKDAREPCPHRQDPVGEQLERWERMLDGRYEPGGCVVRVKTDMDHDDPALRDWVGLRIVDIDEHPHPRTGAQHRVWPLLDFQSAVEDHLQGTTHILRGKDLADSERKQRFLYEHFGWEYPEVLHWGRVGVHGFGAFSTSTMREEIEAGTYTGWDDPRLPTLLALRRRGFLPEAIMDFWKELGLTEKDIEVSVDTLEAENRKLLDERADRLFFVRDPVEIEVEDQPEPVTVPVPRHPDDPDRGARELAIDGTVHLPGEAWRTLDEGTVLRLKDGADVRKTGPASAAWVARGMTDERDGPILEWAPAEALEATVLRPDASTHEGLVEPTAAEAADGTVVQFERYGFARLESTDEPVRAVFGHR